MRSRVRKRAKARYLFPWTAINNAENHPLSFTSEDGQTVIASTYDYSPYGAVTATGIDQPLQWSSEVYDSELGMVYYKYRHYNPRDRRWIKRDPIAEQGGWNLYGFVGNMSTLFTDVIGAYSSVHAGVSQMLAQGKTLAEIAAILGISIAEVVRRATPKGKKMRCTDCSPRQGTIMYRCDATGKAHGPVSTPHYHLYRVNQSPKTCECFVYPTRECVKVPPAGAIPQCIVAHGIPVFV